MFIESSKELHTIILKTIATPCITLGVVVLVASTIFPIGKTPEEKERFAYTHSAIAHALFFLGVVMILSTYI